MSLRAQIARLRARHPRASRITLLALASLLGMEIVYVAGINAVLAAHVIDDAVNEATGDVEMHMTRAWSLWPGRVHVEGFSFRVNDSNVQALLTASEAYARVELLPLLTKKVILHDAEAHGARYWMRHRVSAITADNRAQIDAYPPIPGAEPPLFDPAKQNAPPPSADALWEIELHDGVADGDEIWIQEFHYRGAYRGRGSFVFAPLRWFELLPTVGRLERGSVDLGEHHVSTDFQANLRLALARFEVPKVRGLEPLRGLDASVTLEANVADGKWLALYAAQGLPLSSLHETHLAGTLEFRDQHFTEATDLTLESARLAFKTDALHGGGALMAAIQGRPQGHLAVRLDAPDTTVAPSSVPALGKAPWHLLRTVVELDVLAKLDAPPSFALHRLRTTLAVPNLEWLAALSGGAWKGTGKLETTLSVKPDGEGALAGTFDTILDDTRLDSASLALAFAGTSKGQLVAARDLKRVQFTNVSLSLPAFTLRSGGVRRTSAVSAKIPSMTVSTQPALQVQGSAQVQVQDSALLTVPIEAEGGVGAMVARWLSDGPASVQATFAAGPAGPTVNVTQARVGQATLRGFMGTAGGAPWGAFLVEALGLSNGVRIDRGGASVAPLAGEAWLREQRARAR